MTVVAVVGAATALLAAVIALVQVDVKRVLAYSTISQLGYMVLGVGAAAYGAALFHLMTHAFFKALLFLGAGSVMHAMEHGFHHGAHGHDDPKAAAEGDGVPAEQDMRQMGGLWSKLPRTAPAIAVGGLALAGVFPLSGFWSKDEILLGVFAHGSPLWTALYAVGLATAFLTALYTGRMLLLVLAGAPRSAGARAAAESPPVMTLPLVALAVLSAVAGAAGIPLGGRPAWLAAWLEPVLGPAEHAAAPALLLAGIATAVAAAGLALAWAAYGPRASVDPARIARGLPWAFRLAAGKFYVDELYAAAIVRPFRVLADVFWRADDKVIDGVVNAVGRSIAGAATRVRPAQSGYVRTYAVSMLAGAAVLVAFAWWMAR
jgi:NADH-quinone oxidoreductase subunit L